MCPKWLLMYVAVVSLLYLSLYTSHQRKSSLSSLKYQTIPKSNAPVRAVRTRRAGRRCVDHKAWFAAVEQLSTGGVTHPYITPPHNANYITHNHTLFIAHCVSHILCITVVTRKVGTHLDSALSKLSHCL